MKKIFLIFSAGLILTACNHVSGDTHNEATQETVTENSEADEDQPIALNNGEKWAVNDEMKPFIESGENYLNDYVAEGKEDNGELADQLKEENDELIKSCTMTGKSHDELHKWLHPHLELVKALKDADNKEDAEKIVGELKESFNTYHQYFN